MTIKLKVASVKRRTETVTARGKEDESRDFVDVVLVPIEGDLWEGSPAGQMRLTVDAPEMLDRFVEGSEFVVEL